MKYAFIMRGVPGSGKSTLAKAIATGFRAAWGKNAAAIHSTDDLCMVDGEYKWDAELANKRHDQNLVNFVESLAREVPCVIVDNTNVKRTYFASYTAAAEAYGYVSVVVEVPHPTPEAAAERNTHGVPIEVIRRMLEDWEPSVEPRRVPIFLHLVFMLLAFVLGVSFGLHYAVSVLP